MDNTEYLTNTVSPKVHKPVQVSLVYLLSFFENLFEFIKLT